MNLNINLGGFNIRRKTTFYDIDVLASFLYVNREDLLKTNFSKIIISNIAYKKIASPSCPKLIKESLNRLIDESFVKVEEIHIPSKTFDSYCFIMDHFNDKIISKSEAAALALAIKNKGMLACNDLNVFKKCIDKYDLEHINSADIILLSYQKKLISKDEALEIWKKMHTYRVPLPNKTFKEYLESL